MEYRGYPLSQIQQDVEWTFSEVLFNYTHFHVYNELTTSTSDKGKLEALSSSGFEQTNFDLVVSVSRRLTDGTMSLILVYNPIVFDGDLMYRMGGYYASAFEQMLEAPERPHDAQSLLGEKEQRQILIEWNQTAVSYAEDLCMHQLFEIQAAKTPRSAAVEYEGQRLSYAELESKANRLAHYLMRRGVGPEVRVAICMGRSLDMIVGLLGILKAGGAYVPLDPSYPADRLNFMLEDAEVNLILTQEQMLGKLGTDGKFGKAPAVVCLDRQWQEIAAEPESWPSCAISPNNLAYIYYTSGSTGRPKGVCISHQGIANYIRWAINAYRAAEGNGAAVHSSIAVDLTLTNLLPLFAGQQITLAEEGPGVDGLVKLLEKEPEWGLLKLTPTHLTFLTSHLGRAEKIKSARTLVIGGEQLLAESTQTWRADAPAVELVNEYGPTETVVGCSIYRVQDESPRQGNLPIGRPIANITMYVLGADLQPMPIGAPGELYIGGIGVGRCYWRRPEMTAQKFLPDPFAGTPGARFYRTGDQARSLPDGNLEFLGRFDHQVKIRGFRIELGEIEAVLSGHPDVQQALVVVRENEPGQKQLVGYVVIPGGKERARELRQYLREQLPEHMVPGHWWWWRRCL